MKSHLCECNLFVVVATTTVDVAIVVVVAAIVFLFYSAFQLPFPFLSIVFYFISFLFAYVQNNHFAFSVYAFGCGFISFIETNLLVSFCGWMKFVPRTASNKRVILFIPPPPLWITLHNKMSAPWKEFKKKYD